MAHTFLLIRHCQATGQAPDAPLTRTGEAQARHLASALANEHVDRIISSPFARAVRTIEPFAAARGLPVDTDVRLVERALSGEPRADWQDRLRASFEDFDVRLPGGESSREAMRRAHAVVQDVLAAGDGCTVLVTHGNLLALLLRSFDGTSGFETWAALRNPDVYRVHVTGERTSVERLEFMHALL